MAQQNSRKKKVIRVHAAGLKSRDFDYEVHTWGYTEGRMRIEGKDFNSEVVAVYPEYSLLEVIEVTDES